MTYISKYLMQCFPTKSKKTPAARAAGARMFTSKECSKMIFEYEEKKQKEREEKEQRKGLREQKKKEREEVAKLKAEGIEKKARSCKEKS